MTDEDLTKLSARDKRALIGEAVNVMGLAVCRSCWNFIDPETCGCGDAIKSHSGYEGHSAIPMGCRCGYAEQPQSESVPDYANDVRVALSLCDFLAEQGWRCNLGNGLDKTWECEFMRRPTATSREDDIGIHQGERLEIHYAPADTLAQAIADCFLLTIAQP